MVPRIASSAGPSPQGLRLFLRNGMSLQTVAKTAAESYHQFASNGLGRRIPRHPLPAGNFSLQNLSISWTMPLTAGAPDSVPQFRARTNRLEIKVASVS